MKVGDLIKTKYLLIEEGKADTPENRYHLLGVIIEKWHAEVWNILWTDGIICKEEEHNLRVVNESR